MFGIPMEVITMLGSTVGGAVMRIWSQSNADKADQWKMALEAGRENELSRSAAREWSTPHANWTRKFLVVSFMTMAMFIILAPLLGQTTQVPIISTEGFKLLFLDFTHEVTEYIQLEGIVTPEWLSHAIMAVVGLYFGASISSRR
jgi:hypothetical protein|tara:strand:+ start:308 stop:742 length:435 start_codon:yes stop_codon:yes gene_type:complete